MSYPAIKLITEAYFLGAVVGKGFNAPTADQASEGLSLLNDILAEKSVDTALNPYYTQYTFNTISGKEDYFITNLIEPETVTFVLNTVRYVSQVYSRAQYWNTFRANSVSTLPVTCTYERKLDGCTIYFYPLPNQVYPVTIWGQFSLPSVNNLQQNLLDSFDPFYISYLKFALAARLCMFYGKTIPIYTEKQLVSLELQLNKQVSNPDLTNTKVSTLTNSTCINYAFVNLSNGFVPGGSGL